MAIKGNFKIDFAPLTALQKAAKDLPIDLAIDLALDAQLKARERASPPAHFETGHNRDSIVVVPPTGKLMNQGSPKSERGPFTNAPRQAVRPDRVALATASGYGLWTEIGTQYMAGDHYLRGGLADAMRNAARYIDAKRVELEIVVAKQRRKAFAREAGL